MDDPATHRWTSAGANSRIGQSLHLLTPRTSTLTDNNRGRTLSIVTWFLIGTSMTVVCLRCWSKFKHARQLYLDDAIMIFAVSCGVVYSVLVQLAICGGYGRHIDHIAKDKMPGNVLFGSLSMLFGALGAMAGRISFCCTLLFLIRTDPRVRSWPVYVCIVLQIVLNLTGIIVLFTQCGEVFEGGPEQQNYYDYCADPALQMYMKYVVGAWNVATDLYLAVLPAILISHTKVSMRSKLGLGSLLCLSALALVAASAKTYEAKVLQNVADYTWSLVPYTLCTSIELNIIIISASVALLRPLFRRQKPSSFSVPRDDTWEGPSGDQITLNSVTPSQIHDRRESEIKRESTKSSLTRSQSDGITVTTVVDVSYHTSSAPVVHASLIGLLPNSDYIRYPESTDQASTLRWRCW